jgi:hypothetical protein
MTTGASAAESAAEVVHPDVGRESRAAEELGAEPPAPADSGSGAPPELAAEAIEADVRYAELIDSELMAAVSDEAGSVSLLADDGVVVVAMHGAIGHRLHSEVRDLVHDVVTDALGTAGRPVRVLCDQVTTFELPGVWLLVELRRASRPSLVTLVNPTPAVLDAVSRHQIAGLAVEG